MKSLTTLFLLLFVLSSCQKRCENVKVGSVDLNEISSSFTPYEEGENIVFVNSEGEEKSFTTHLVEEEYELCVKFRCELTTGPYETTPCDYYTAQGIRNSLYSASDSLQIELVVSTENYLKETTDFYDFFSINMLGPSGVARGEFIPYIGFTDPVLETENTILREPFVEEETINLLDKSYQNILHTEEAEDMVFYQKSKGVVGIKLSGELWVLK